MTSTIPPDLAARVRDASAQLDGLEQEINELREAITRGQQAMTGAAALQGKISHDFASIRTAVGVLMAELDERAPVTVTPKPPMKGG